MDRKANLEAMYHFTPSLIGRQVNAEYLPQEIIGYKNSPFIEALPAIFEEEFVGSKIARFPDHNDEQRKLGKQTRLHLIQQIADYVEPLPSHLLVEQRLSRLMRHGYKARNPLTRESVKQFHIGFQNILESGVNDGGFNLAGIRSTASGFAILGVSGQGKTTAIESSLLLYPQVIHHSMYQGQPFIRKQLVWLKLNCPHDGSLKGLCFNFLQAVDSVLETNYFRKFASKGSSVDMLLPIMAHIATLHGLGALVIDEIQNLSFMKSGGAERMLNYFTQLINTIGVPVILIGTFKAMKLLSGSFSQARRSTGQGDMIMDRLTEGEEWDYFIERLWKYQWTSTCTKLTDSLKKEMYKLSQGIVDIAVKLYMLAQWEVITHGEDNKERVTIGLLRNVASRHMQLVQPLLQVLKRNDPSAKLLVDDLYPQWDVLDQFLRNSEEKVNIQGEIRSKLLRDENIELDQNRYLELVKTAIDFGVPAENAEELAKRILLRNETESDLVRLRKELLQEIELTAAAADIHNPISDNQMEREQKRRPRNRTTRKTEPSILDVDDLRNAVSSHNAKSGEIYENLVELGTIPSEEDLSKLII